MSMRHVFALRAAIGATSASAAGSTTLLRTTRTWDGAEIEYPRTRCPEVHAVVVEIPANDATPVHLHSVSNYAFVMEVHERARSRVHGALPAWLRDRQRAERELALRAVPRSRQVKSGHSSGRFIFRSKAV